MEILAVCTGNICRSPLAELVLRTGLDGLGVEVHSAGTHGLDAVGMPPEARRLAVDAGVPAADADAHRSRYLTPAMIEAADLILTMTREHRRDVALKAPTRMRSLFTVREFARLADGLTDEELRAAADAAGANPSARLRAVAVTIADRRGLVMPPASLDVDDVIDPYGRSRAVYDQSAAQLLPALSEVERVIRAIV